MCNPLIIIRIYFLSRALPALWKCSPSLPALLMEMTPGPVGANAWAGTIAASWRSNLSFNRGDHTSQLLTLEGQRAESIVGSSRGSGR
ncbi:hypothetical protein [Pseudomonas sp. B28(2017)]|uniref:hypothetical protein n=1 Tax=Pseudomonas sp. B28(2017) TaxID=1981730 RepID=UPI000A1F4B12|nr:hypothetical protein [Pseudomonas sp. B28(2017)]